MNSGYDEADITKILMQADRDSNTRCLKKFWENSCKLLTNPHLFVTIYKEDKTSKFNMKYREGEWHLNRSALPKIDKIQRNLVDFYILPIHYSLFPENRL